MSSMVLMWSTSKIVFSDPDLSPKWQISPLKNVCMPNTSKLLFKSHTAIGFYVKTMSAHGSHLGWRSWSPDTILKVNKLFHCIKSCWRHDVRTLVNTIKQCVIMAFSSSIKRAQNPKMITGSTEQTGHFCLMFCTRNIVRYYFRLYILKWRFNINNLVLNVRLWIRVNFLTSVAD
jgi:hypothetical protein